MKTKQLIIAALVVYIIYRYRQYMQSKPQALNQQAGASTAKGFLYNLLGISFGSFPTTITVTDPLTGITTATVTDPLTGEVTTVPVKPGILEPPPTRYDEQKPTETKYTGPAPVSGAADSSSVSKFTQSYYVKTPFVIR